MAVTLQHRRGTESQNNSFTGAVGEITVDTTNKRLRLHDGVKSGGKEILTKAEIDGIVYFPTASMTTLLSVDTSVYTYASVIGYTTANDGGGGLFNYDATIDKATANAGTIIDPSVSLALQGTGIGLGCWIRQYSGAINVKWFGVKGDGISDDTSIIQSVLDSQAHIYFPPSTYKVSKLTLDSSISLCYGDKAIIAGNATVSTSSIVEIKQGVGLEFYGFIISASQNQNYKCALHWYTNDLNTYFPGKASIHDLQLNEALIGFCIGALPSQTLSYAQGVVAPDGEATNAPISENLTYGIKTTDCINGLYVDQGNGKLMFTDCYFASEYLSWTAPPAADSLYSAVTLGDLYTGEVSFTSCSIEAIQKSTGSLIDMQYGGAVYIDNCIIEATASTRLAGQFILRMSKVMNFGFNSSTNSMFLVEQDSTGILNVDNSWLAFPPQAMATSTGFLVKSFTGLNTSSAGAFAKNASCIFDNVSLVDIPEEYGVTGFRWGCYNVKPVYRGCELSSVNATTGLKIFKIPFDNTSTNVLDGLVDTSAKSITAYGANGNATSGGWTFFSGGGVVNWGSIATTGLSLGTDNGVEDDVPIALKVQAASGASLQATTGVFNVSQFATINIRGLLKFDVSSGDVIVLQYTPIQYDGTAGTTENITFGATNLVGTAWTTFNTHVRQKKGYTKGKFTIYASGLAVEVADLSIHITRR